MADSATPTARHASSLWFDGVARPEFPALGKDRMAADIVVLGGGLTGVLTAWLLRDRGAKVVLLEADRIGSGVTGHTTAKLTTQHGLIYAELAETLGPEAAQAYAGANQDGFEMIRELAGEGEGDVGFAEHDAFAYIEGDHDSENRRQVEREVEVAQELGLPATFEEDTQLPYEAGPAVRFAGQAEIHPLRFLLSLTARMGDDVKVFEQTRAVDVSREHPHVIETAEGGSVEAEQVVLATHTPFPYRGLAFARLAPSRSYVLVFELEGDGPAGMHIGTGERTRSIRTYTQNGRRLLMVGGAGHRVGEGDPPASYRELEGWAREHFPVGEIAYRWSAQDDVSTDRVPLVGPLTPGDDSVLVACGFAKWGLSNAGAAARILTDRLVGRQNPWAEAFNPHRLTLRASAPSLIDSGVRNAVHLLGDRVRPAPGLGEAKDLRPGEGRVFRDGLKRTAVSRDADGELRALSARCPHLGCIVAWNAAEQSWDCPCHGSRFGADGALIRGPAIGPLDAAELE